MEQMEVVYLPAADINEAAFNPPSRVNAKSINDLIEDIRMYGILVPLALTRSRVLADGHRRFKAAKQLKLDKLPCIIHPTNDAMELWSRLNRDTKPITPREWTEVVGKGMPISELPPRKQSQYIGLQRILTKEEFAQFLSMKKSSGVLQSAYNIAHKCGDTSDSFVREILLWTMQYEQFNLLKNAINEGMSVDAVIDIVLNRKKMHRGWA